MVPAYPQRIHDPGFNHDHHGALTGMAKMEMDAIDASFVVVGLASAFMLVGCTRTKTAKSIRRVASFAINKPSRPDLRSRVVAVVRHRFLESLRIATSVAHGSKYGLAGVP